MGNARPFYVDIMVLHKGVTGSCILINIKFPDGNVKRILIDCGLFQEEEYTEFNSSFPFNASHIDYVLVTHNHVDHTGRLPLLVKKGYRGRIHVSYDTSTLIANALYDSCKVLKKRSEFRNEKPLYTDEDVETTLSLIASHPFEESVYLEDNIKFTFFMNGHLPGAAIILLQIRYHDREKHYENINLLFTGDYHKKNMFFDVKPIPRWVHQLPIHIIQEATYGDMNSSEITTVFEKNVLEAISHNFQVVCPVFSLGRSQEILYVLKKWQDSGKLDKNIPIYLDGKLGIRYTKLYTNDALFLNEECKNFLPENFTYVANNAMRENLLKDESCKIILTTSGMGSYGPAQIYLPNFLRKPNALIHFTGYLAENTLGRRIYEAEPESVVEVAGLTVKKLAKVKFTSEFSAHAKADELLQFLKDFENIKTILINHGEDTKKDAYATKVVNEINAKNVGILGRDYFFRLDGYGLIKSCTTKFH